MHHHFVNQRTYIELSVVHIKSASHVVKIIFHTWDIMKLQQDVRTLKIGMFLISASSGKRNVLV